MAQSFPLKFGWPPTIRSMVVSEAESATMKLRALGKASHSLSKDERFELAVAAEAAKETMEAAADELVQKAAGWPMLCSRSCDGAPMQVAQHFSRTLPGSNRKVRSVGKASKEFLVKTNSFDVTCQPRAPTLALC